ncbi:adenylate/guanylate cyclase domain-containing protein [Lyngbya aestuarii]|uniref:adenylate/guanylate cyclase domain-containing protein n=1 Tax=Lyngbya aestuarii TaxID=118322 RepID=UPI00403DF583
MSKPVIICVDDERIVLVSLRDQLSQQLGSDYEIELAESAQEALEILEELQAEGVDVPLIISDQIMPGMKGDELLIQVHSRYPKTLKIMLTGQAGTESVGNAVNSANLYRYIAKPWETTDLGLTITEALRSYRQSQQLAEQNEALQKVNAQLKQLNTFLEQKVAERTVELTTANTLLQKEIAERKQAELALLESQRQSDQLLLNILPESIADQLKQRANLDPLKSYDCSLAEYIEEATILFADIVGFTPLAARMPPIELVNLLNEIFSTFDQLAEKHCLEKIKTIGDAYMVAGGLPTPSGGYATAVASSCIVACTADLALAMQEAITRFSNDLGEMFQIRIGISIGSVVAGVIGIKKFSYDLWGDAVNIASRMEAQGIPGKIQVTTATYERLKEQYLLEKRGTILVKGKGKMTTYWLTGKI